MSLAELLKEKLMKRKIEQWENCNPASMAMYMSTEALEYALADAIADILCLWDDNQRLRLLEEENQKLRAELQDSYTEGYNLATKEAHSAFLDDSIYQ